MMVIVISVVYTRLIQCQKHNGQSPWKSIRVDLRQKPKAIPRCFLQAPSSHSSGGIGQAFEPDLLEGDLEQRNGLTLEDGAHPRIELVEIKDGRFSLSYSSRPFPTRVSTGSTDVGCTQVHADRLGLTLLERY